MALTQQRAPKFGQYGRYPLWYRHQTSEFVMTSDDVYIMELSLTKTYLFSVQYSFSIFLIIGFKNPVC